jgi:hypothetical protein
MSRRSIFDFLAELPAETYSDQMVLNGFTEFEPEDQVKTPWISHGLNPYHIGVELDYMEAFAAEAFREFGGTDVSRVLEFSGDELHEYFDTYDNQDRFGIYGSIDDLTRTVSRYLAGQRSDVECSELIESVRR